MKPKFARKAPAPVPLDTLLVLLPDDAGQAVDWWRLDPAGQCVDRGIWEAGSDEGGPGATGAGEQGPPVVVAVGAGCAVHRLEVRAHSVPQATAAARAMLAADLAGDEGVHVAVAPEADGGWLAAVASVDDMERWIAAVRNLGLEPRQLVPAALLLPPPIDTAGDADGADARVLAAEHRERWICRGAGLAFTAEAGLARTVLEGRPTTPVPLAVELLAAGALAPPLNLLQGSFAPAGDAPRGAAAWRRSGGLAAIVLATLLLAPAFRAGIDQWQARKLEHQALQEARAGLPGLPPDADALTALRARVLASRNVLDFSNATAGLMASVQAVPGTSLDGLTWQGGRLQAIVGHGGAGDVDALRAQLASRGFELVEEGRSAGGGDHLRISLEPRQ